MADCAEPERSVVARTVVSNLRLAALRAALPPSVRLVAEGVKTFDEEGKLTGELPPFVGERTFIADSAMAARRMAEPRRVLATAAAAHILMLTR